MGDQPNFGMPIHPACDLFPLMDADGLAGLAADIRANGLVNPIVLHEGQVVDGRNRLLACQQAGMEPRFVQWRAIYDGPVPLTRWIWSENVERRHLTKAQVAFAIVAMKALEKKQAAHDRQIEAGVHGTEGGRGNAKTPTPKVGGRVSTPEPQAPSKERTARETRVVLAKEAGVSKHLIQRALNVQNASPELVKAVAQGVISPREAEKQLSAVATPAPTPATPASSKRQQMIENAANRRMIAILSQTRGLCRGLAELNMGALRNTSTAEEMETWAAIARESAKQLRTFASELAEKRSETQ